MYSQDNFIPGNYTDNNNNIIKGFINDKKWTENPVDFEFKRNLDDDENVLTIENVKRFELDNASIYERHQVNIDKSSDNINKLNQQREPTFKEETLFLKVVLSGDISLLKYRDNIKNHFYYKKDNLITLLVHKRYLTTNGAIAENNSFKQQLVVNIKCSNKDILNTENVTYSENSLVKLFEKYYKCNDQADTFTLYKEKNKIELGIKLLVGFYTNSFEVNSNQRRTFDYGSNSGFLPGLELEAMLPNKKWSIFLDARYHTFDGDGVIDVSVPLDNTTIPIPTEATYSAVDFGLGGRYYSQLTEDISLYFGLNASIDFISNNEVFYNDPAAMDLVDIGGNLAIGIGLGVDYKGFNGEIRYHTPRDTVVTGATESVYNLLMFSLSYKFLNF